MTVDTNDPMTSAMETELRPRTYFGQVQSQAYYAVLVKGIGKVPFDPTQHSIDKRVTAIEISLMPLIGGSVDTPIDRELIAESHDWAKIVKPSLLALNTDLRGVNGKWTQVQLVPVGSYTNKSGEEKTRTMFKFIALYASEDECRAASDAFFPRSDVTTAPAPAPAAPNGSNAERAAAAKFLPALWAASQKDATKFATLIANQSALAKHFDISSPEVVAVIAA
ncbi:MAG: hypothetical protein ACYC4L_05135 [Chloroflexota bacterium]